MDKGSGVWRLRAPVLFLIGLCVLVYVVFYVMAWGRVIAGEDTILIFSFFNIDEAYPLTGFQIATGMICLGVLVVAMTMVFLSTNRFFKEIEKGGFFAEGVSKSMRSVGISVGLYWVGMVLAEDFLPFVLTRNLPDPLRQDFEWFPLDPNIIILLIALIVVVAAEGLKQAHHIDQDNKQFI